MEPETGTPAPDGQRQDAVPALRASDDERHKIAEFLGEQAAAGRLTLSELEERVGRAYAATTRAELTELTRDLPGPGEALSPQPAQVPSRERRRRRWFFAIMGGSTWRGRSQLPSTVNVISIMGGDDIDLREAQIVGDELVVNAVSVMGGTTIYVPDSVEVELSGPAIMGGNDQRGSNRPARPGAPVLRIRSFAIMGGVDVWRLPTEARGLGLKEARRMAKALERGTER